MSETARTQSILVEGIPNHIGSLGSLWDADDTFAYVASKSAISREWIADSLERLPEPYRIGHFCLLTSGSTGVPKLVIGRKSRSEQLVKVLHDVQQSEAVEETIVSLPLSYCYAFVNQWLWSRVYNRRIVVTPGLSQPNVFLETLRVARDAMLCLVGPQVALLAQMFGEECFPGVIRVHFAGGRFPQEKIPLLKRMFPSALIFNNYGCAEAMPRLTLRRAEEAEAASDIGRPLPGVRLKTGGSGELLFLSEYRSVGLVDDAGFQAIADDEWIPSGDLAHCGDNGRWQLLGRPGEVFKRYGEKVAVPQILATVNRHWPGQIGYYRDKDGAGEDGYVLVLCPPPLKDQLQLLFRAFRTSHSRTHWPLRIESAVSLPLLPNGKVDGLALRVAGDKFLHWRQRV